MTVLAWTEYYTVYVREMDEHHQELFIIINELFDYVGKCKNNKETILRLLKRLKDYANYHFSAEEALLDKYDYPGLEEQKDSHKYFIDKIAEFQKDFEEGKFSTLPGSLLKFTRDWIREHIVKVDRKYGAFLNQKGVR